MNLLTKLFLLTILAAAGFANAEGAAVHGMVIFGGSAEGKTLYASHVPMFHQPHDFQAIFEISVSRPRVEVEKLYRAKAFKEGKQLLMTLKPRPFVLPQLLSGKVNSFVAEIYQGNFEDGGVKILDGVTVTVNKIVHQHQLKLSAEPVNLSYLILKDGYAAHLIAAPNSFDEIVQLKETLPEGVKVFEGTEDALGFRLSQGALASGFYCTVGPDFFNPCE